MCVPFRCVCMGGRTAEREIPVWEQRYDYGNDLCNNECRDLMLVLIDLRRQDRISLQLPAVD